MNNHTESVGYGKLLKGTGIFVVLFIAMCWILTKTEERDNQVQSQLAVAAPVEAAPPPVAEPVEPEVLFYYYTPKELHDEFEANEVRITHKLAGNVLVLRGKISGIGLSLGRPVVDISVPNSYDTIKVYFDSSKIDIIAKLNVGDFLQVRSLDVSLNPFGTIHLRDSSIWYLNFAGQKP